MTVTLDERESREAITAVLQEAERMKKQKEILAAAGYEDSARSTEWREKTLLSAFYKMLHADNEAGKESDA